MQVLAIEDVEKLFDEQLVWLRDEDEAVGEKRNESVGTATIKFTFSFFW